MGEGVGAQRPFLRVNQPKKTGARSARARTRGQNPLVLLYSAITGEVMMIPCIFYPIRGIRFILGVM